MDGLLDSSARIIYTGETDVVVSQSYLSLTFRKEWFFSKDKHCFGIPVSMECTDTTGDAFIAISLHDANNNLNVSLSLDIRQKYNGIVWVDSSSKDCIVNIETNVRLCGKFFPQSIQVDFCSAILNESFNNEQNKDRKQNCFNSLDFFELWKLRENTLCLDGIVLSTVLQNMLRPNGYLVYPREYPGSDYHKFDRAFYVWCGLHVGSPSEVFYYTPPEEAGDEQELNALKIQAALSRHITPDGSSVLSDELCIFATDKDHPNSSLNSISHISYSFFMEDVVWDTDLTNLVVHFEPDEINDVLKQQYLDIPVKYNGKSILLRLILNPNWDILFIVIQNKLQES
ncbi:hypothetical protein LI177_00450 [bacterium 210820-DFI.6.37]|nr:hypothetical protein [bacterium 210820-DFI.6.37]